MEKEKFLSFFPPKKKNILNANLIVYPREKDKPKIHERQLKLQCMSINMIICQMNDKKKNPARISEKKVITNDYHG